MQEISETEARLKKLRMRSWRRGMKEMDLILGPFADTRLADLPNPVLDAYEALLEENDQDLYLWVTGARACPAAIAPMMQMIAQTTMGHPQADKPVD